MDDHIYLLQRHIKEMMPLDNLKAFIHERCGVYGDFASHAPCGMLKGLLGRDLLLPGGFPGHDLRQAGAVRAILVVAAFVIDGKEAVEHHHLAGGAQFAGTDAYLDAGELKKVPANCGDLIEFPAYISPIAVAYRLQGVEDLQLSAPTLAQIFAGKIKTWNDPAITAERGRIIKTMGDGLLLEFASPGDAVRACLLYTSDAADDLPCVDLGGRRNIKKKKENQHRYGTTCRDTTSLTP